MLKVIALLTTTTVGFAIVGAPTQTSAATKQRAYYEAKKAQCHREAKAKHFGIHFNQRDRWIIECIARS
jgi:hypothetical protein